MIRRGEERFGRPVIRRSCFIGIAAGFVFLTHLARAADYAVDPTGVRGPFRTIQAAHDAIAGQTAENRAHILIAPGRYREQVSITKPHVSLIGLGDSPTAVCITFNRMKMGGETLNIPPTAVGFMARNLTFENAQPHQMRVQALAVRSMADRAIFDNVRFLSYQDTLMLDGRSRQYLRNCFISGDVDFIFGEATAVFDHCILESTDRGFITAANTRKITAHGFVFLDCTLVKGRDRRASGNPTTAASDRVFLGRPWFWYAPGISCSVIFIRAKMGPHIRREGWDPWDVTNDPTVDPKQDRDPRTRYSEFGSMDLNGSPLPLDNRGVPIGRVPWQDPMTAEHAANYTLENIFGPACFWNETTQPETSGMDYVDIGPPWNPLEQMALLPATDSM